MNQGFYIPCYSSVLLVSRLMKNVIDYCVLTVMLLPVAVKSKQDSDRFL